MDSKQMVVIVVLLMALGFGWQLFLVHEYRVHPEWKRTDEPTTSSPAASTPVIEAAPGTQPSQLSPATTQSAGGWQFASPAAGQSPTATTTIGSDQFEDPRYHMSLAISAAGAGLDSVVLNQYHQEVDSPALFTFQSPYELDPKDSRSLGTMAVVVDGHAVATGDAGWNLIDQTDASATYAADIQGPDPRSRVQVEKQYVVEQASDDRSGPQGYEVQVNYSLSNLSPDAHTVALQFNGPTVPHAETARQETEIVAGYSDDPLVSLVHEPLSYFRGNTQSKDFVPNDDKLPMVWMGATSNYFNALVRPRDTGKLASAVATALNPDSPTTDRLVSIRFTTVNFKLAAGASAKLPLRVFFGPKRRDLLGSAYYSAFPLQYDRTLVMITGWLCGLCTFPWLISFLVSVLAGLHFVLRDWGLAIIALVCIVRIILHPITKRSQVSMMKMQKLAPEMERLKKKFGDDKEGFQKAQMELYKGVGFTPVLGCLPMVFQMPIFIALWRALQTTFELRQAPFLYFFGIHFTWIRDLSQPDDLVKFSSPIPLIFGMSLASINVLPLAMAVVTFINQKYFTPKPAAASPEQESQQKMMTWMTLVFPLMFYTFPSGLSLYYLTTTSLGIVESKIVRNHIKKAEAAGSDGPVIVDAGKPTRAARRRQEEQDKEPKKKGWLQRLQDKAEEIAQQNERQKKKR